MFRIKTMFSFRRLLSLGLVLNLFVMRPSALGERYTAIGVLVAPLLTGMYLFHTHRNTRYTTPRLRGETAGLLALTALYWVYIAPVSIFFQRSQLLWTMYELVTTGVIVVSYSAFLLDINANRLFFRQLCNVVALLGLSSCVTVLLTWWLGSKDGLYLFSLAVKGYADYEQDPRAATGAVYFPLSMLYGGYTSGMVSFDRYCGFFREAGIYQAVACFCMIYEALTRRSWLVMACLVGGIVCAFSTLGVALLALSIGLVVLLSSKSSKRLLVPRMLVTVAVVAMAWPLALYTPYIGLKDKAQTHGASLSDRAGSIERGVANFTANPLGFGLFSGKEENDGISLLAQMGMIGLFGFACQVAILSACSPLLITALVSQPIAGAPTIYVILLAYLPRIRQYRQQAAMERSNRPVTTAAGASPAAPAMSLLEGASHRPPAIAFSNDQVARL
jgi:hypothetical protein